MSSFARDVFEKRAKKELHFLASDTHTHARTARDRNLCSLLSAKATLQRSTDTRKFSALFRAKTSKKKRKKRPRKTPKTTSLRVQKSTHFFLGLFFFFFFGFCHCIEQQSRLVHHLESGWSFFIFFFFFPLKESFKFVPVARLSFVFSCSFTRHLFLMYHSATFAKPS